MNIVGEKVILRAMEPDDMEMYREMINDPNTEYMVGGWSFPVSIVEQQRWYEKAAFDKNNLRLTIVLKESNKAVGMISLANIDWKNRSATYSGIKLFLTAPRKKGIGTDATMTIMNYAFEELQLNRLDGMWAAYNSTSLEMFMKCGWKVEGTKKRSVFKHGIYYDRIFGGILVEDFYAAKERIGWKVV